MLSLARLSAALFLCVSVSLDGERRSAKRDVLSEKSDAYVCTYARIITYVQTYRIFFESCGAITTIYIDNTRQVCMYVRTYIAGNSEVFMLSSQDP